MITRYTSPKVTEPAPQLWSNCIVCDGIAYIAGLTAPKGKRMGHAGAIVSAGGESAAEKVEILKAAGITIAKNPSVIGETIASVIKNING